MARACTTSDPFNAIAEPRRRHILEFLASDERSVSEIADSLELNQPSVSKHLIVLRDVGLVTARRDGRKTMYRTNADTLRAIHEWTRNVREVLARTIAAHQGARGRTEMTTTAQATAQPTFTITEEILVQRLNRDDLRFIDRSAWTPQRNARRQAACDGSRSRTRRPLVSRPRRRQWPSLGIRAEHQASVAAGDLGTAVSVNSDNEQPHLPAFVNGWQAR